MDFISLSSFRGGWGPGECLSWAADREPEGEATLPAQALGRLHSGHSPVPFPDFMEQHESFGVSPLASRNHRRVCSRAPCEPEHGGKQGEAHRGGFLKAREGGRHGDQKEAQEEGLGKLPFPESSWALEVGCVGCVGPRERQPAGRAGSPPIPSPAAWLSHKPPGHRKKWKELTC